MQWIMYQSMSSTSEDRNFSSTGILSVQGGLNTVAREKGDFRFHF